MEQQRTFLTLLLVVIGVASLTCGLFSKAAVLPLAGQDPNGGVVQSELVVTREVARGGLTRDASGRIRKTYEGNQAPDACPT